MTARGFDVLFLAIRQTAIVVLGGGLIVALILRALSEGMFVTLFTLVVLGKTVEHLHGRRRRLRDA